MKMEIYGAPTMYEQTRKSRISSIFAHILRTFLQCFARCSSLVFMAILYLEVIIMLSPRKRYGVSTIVEVYMYAIDCETR